MRRPLPTDSEVREILARRRTRPAPRPAPRAIKSLTPVIRDLDARFGKGVSTLEGVWLEVVGQRVAAVSRPQALKGAKKGKGATLELRVTGAGALIVQHEAASIIQKVNLYLGAGAVDRLTFAQGPIRPLKRGVPFRARPAIPLPAAQEAALETAVEAAPDDLKAALKKLGRAVLTQPDPRRR